MRIVLSFIVIYYVIVGTFGIYLLIRLHSQKPVEMMTGIIHGAMGLLGLAFIIMYISFQKNETPIVAFLLLLMAFFFGAGMFVAKLSGRKFPKAVAYVHAAFAISGLIFLVSFWINSV